MPFKRGACSALTGHDVSLFLTFHPDEIIRGILMNSQVVRLQNLALPLETRVLCQLHDADTTTRSAPWA
jgi:hypothetical protein